MKTSKIRKKTPSPLNLNYQDIKHHLQQILFTTIALNHYGLFRKYFTLQQHPFYNEVQNWLKEEGRDYPNRHQIRCHITKQICSLNCPMLEPEAINTFKQIHQQQINISPQFPDSNLNDQQILDLEILYIIHIISLKAR